MQKLSRRVIARTIAEKLTEHPSERKHWLGVLAAHLVEQNRVDELDLIMNDIAHELFERSGELLVTTVSANPLSEALRSELKSQLMQATKAKKVALTEEVDPSLLGGLIARTPDAVADMSVRTKLKQLATIA
jgi:F-type H+-transporting ATPase subunit delta